MIELLFVFVVFALSATVGHLFTSTVEQRGYYGSRREVRYER